MTVLGAPSLCASRAVTPRTHVRHPSRYRRLHSRRDTACSYHETCLFSGVDPTHDEVIKGGDRVAFRPQADLARAIAGVVMIQEEHAIEVGLDVITDRYHADGMPLAKRRRFDSRRRQLVPPTVVVIQAK